MASLDTLEGYFGQDVWYHYDVGNDVLHLRLIAQRWLPVVGDEEADFTLFRNADSDEVAGLELVNWWKRFGHGPLPDSLRTIHDRMQPWVEKLIEWTQAADHRANV